LLEPAPNVQLR